MLNPRKTSPVSSQIFPRSEKSASCSANKGLACAYSQATSKRTQENDGRPKITKRTTQDHMILSSSCFTKQAVVCFVFPFFAREIGARAVQIDPLALSLRLSSVKTTSVKIVGSVMFWIHRWRIKSDVKTCVQTFFHVFPWKFARWSPCVLRRLTEDSLCRIPRANFFY